MFPNSLAKHHSVREITTQHFREKQFRKRQKEQGKQKYQDIVLAKRN